MATVATAISLIGALMPRIVPGQSISGGDSLRVRLLTRINAGHLTEVRAVVIAPLLRDGRVVVPPGALLNGRIDSGGVDASTREHWLAVHFDQLEIPLDGRDTAHLSTRTHFVVIDDARERIDDGGRIVGPPMPSLVRSRRTWLLLALGSLHPVGALATAAVLETEERARHRGIDLHPGFEGTVVLSTGAAFSRWPAWTLPPALPMDSSTNALAASLPERSTVRSAGGAADVITLALIGTADQVRSAFRAASWDSSETVSLRTDFITFANAARGEGYMHQPVSTNYLDGAPPAFVFQKLADTFVRRHHLRVWRSGTSWNGESVWLVAAARDVGIEFSTARRTFAHLTDPHIDDERDKVVADLVAAGHVAAMALVPRAPLTGVAVNDGSAPVVSDWRLAVVHLR